LKGKVHKFGDDIDTDAIIPGPYLKTTNPYELSNYCMVGIDKDFPKKVKEGDFIVAGENFGCGSSREQAPISIKYCGIRAIFAESFARIFYRNCINIGLPPIVCKGISRYAKDGDTIDYIPEKKKVIINEDVILDCILPDGIGMEILKAGGLIKYAQNKNKK